jgi:tripartite-type tricarboxylate transporter receptor subunit TctC
MLTTSVHKRALLIALTAAAFSPSSFAQVPDYPNKPIRVVVTFPPGGSSDAMLRVMAPRIADKLGQQLVIDNKPGAGGNIGLALVSKAAPDGYTLGVGAAGALAANASLYAQMPFDALKDFRPVTLLADIPFVIAGAPSLQARTLQEVIALAKAQPGKLSIAHGGNGTAMHLSTALLEQMAGIKLTSVPYRGSGPATLDVLAGQIPLVMTDLPASLQQIKAGKLVAYAVTSARRLAVLPDVPTVAEAGLPGYESVGWFGLVAPADTPRPIVSRLNSEFVAALNDDAIKASLRKNGMEPAPGTPEAFGAFIRSETQKWARVIREANIKLD